MMLRKLAFAFVIAGFALPFFTICRGLSKGLIAQSAGETDRAAEVMTNEVSMALSATRAGFVLIGIGLALFFIPRRPSP